MGGQIGAGLWRDAIFEFKQNTDNSGKKSHGIHPKLFFFFFFPFLSFSDVLDFPQSRLKAKCVFFILIKDWGFLKKFFGDQNRFMRICIFSCLFFQVWFSETGTIHLFLFPPKCMDIFFLSKVTDIVKKKNLSHHFDSQISPINFFFRYYYWGNWNFGKHNLT